MFVSICTKHLTFHQGTKVCVLKRSTSLPKVGGRHNGNAVVAELADALDSGSSGGNTVEVQVLSTAPNSCFRDLCNADVAQLVERRLAKAKVAGSRPVVRSMKLSQGLSPVPGSPSKRIQGDYPRVLQIWLARKHFRRGSASGSETRRPLHEVISTCALSSAG